MVNKGLVTRALISAEGVVSLPDKQEDRDWYTLSAFWGAQDAAVM